ncbi:hypothetical protein PJL18_03229 [Paenarthrobacter nicotinovorans]|nr:hypothetical protein [Paenarthrobacter nicotinovorans]
MVFVPGMLVVHGLSVVMMIVMLMPGTVCRVTGGRAGMRRGCLAQGGFVPRRIDRVHDLLVRHGGGDGDMG